MLLAPVIALGERIEARWLEAARDPLALPEIAAAALREASLPSQLALTGLVDWALSCPRAAFPPQADPGATFGDPPITLWQGTQLHIDLQIWVDSVPDIHDHAFTGAFQVLAGGSAHRVLRFTAERAWSASLQVGRLEPVHCAALSVGDVCAIGPRGAFIHALVHRQRPSATLVVRTDESPSLKPQMVYLPPGIARASFAPQLGDTLYQRRVQLLELLVRTDDPRLGARLGALLDDADPLLAVDLLQRVFPSLAQEAGPAGAIQRLGGMLRRLEGRYPGLCAPLSVALVEAERRRRLAVLRHEVSEAPLRWLLAALLVAGSRAEVVSLLGVDAAVAGIELLAAHVPPQEAALAIAALTGAPSGLGLPAVAERLLAEQARSGLLGPVFRYGASAL